LPMGPPTTPCPSSRRGGESRIATSMLSLLSAQPLSLGRAHTVQEVPGRQTLSPFKLKLEKFQKRSLAAHDTQTSALGQKCARLMFIPDLARRGCCRPDVEVLRSKTCISSRPRP